MKTMVVDDSGILRRAIASVVKVVPGFTVVAEEVNGENALKVATTKELDLIICDLEMPVMDGLSFIRQFRKTNKSTKILVFSAQSQRGARVTMEALLAGADDFLSKTEMSESKNGGFEALYELLVPRLMQFKEVGFSSRMLSPKKNEAITRPYQPRVIAIGSSTGGPDALRLLLSQISAEVCTPILVAQHMPALFTQELARILNNHSHFDIRQAVKGEEVLPKTVYIAPGDFHMLVRENQGKLFIDVNQNEKVNFVRPSVDVLFENLAKVVGKEVLACVLTGMGADGAKGAEPLVKKGAHIYVQDKESSVVWGMPGAIVGAGLQSGVASLSEMAATIESYCLGRKSNLKEISA